MFDKIRGMRGALYRKFRKKAEETPKTRAGEILFNLKKGMKGKFPKFSIMASKGFITLPYSTEIKNVTYPVINPYAYINIKLDEKDNTLVYNVVEPTLNEEETHVLKKLKEGLVQIIDISFADVKNADKTLEFLETSVQHLLGEYGFDINEKEYVKIMYYVYRDFVGLNKIEPVMNDPYVEDLGCLPEHEKLFVKIDNQLRLTTIGDLLNGEMPGDMAVKTPARSIEALSFNPETLKTEYRKIIGMLRKKNKNGYYVSIRTEGGNEAQVSPDHPMIVLTSGGISVKKASDIAEGDYVLRLKSVEDNPTGSNKIDLIDEFSKLGYREFRVKGAKHLLENVAVSARMLDINPRMISNWKRGDSVPIWAYLKLEKDPSERTRLQISVGQGVKNWLPAVLKIDEDFAFLLGLFLAEGYFEPDAGISFAFGKHEKELYTKTAEIASKIFGTHVKLHEHKTSMVVYCGGKALFHLFRDVFGVGNNSYNKKIPDMAYTWNPELQKAIVKGHFVGDGYIRITDNSRKAILVTASHDLVMGLRYMLFGLGIPTRLCKRNKIFANTWEIYIEGGEILDKFTQLVQEGEVNSFRSSGTNLFPSFLFNPDDYSGAQRKVVVRQIQGSGKLGMKFASLSTNKTLLSFVEGGIHPVKVIDINQVKYDGDFYDIQVEENSNFMHGDFIFTHNCDGLRTPVYIVHSKFGSLRTNIFYNDEQELREFVIKLAERAGRYISYSDPLLDGTLKEGSRVQASLAQDVTTRGPTFSIRKFKDTPFSPNDMMKLKTASADVFAYLWFVVENGANILIAGGVSTGKTSILNTISLFIPTEAKIVSIEDTRELNMPHENWIPGVARIGFTGTGVGEVTMFELLKESFRQNPDYLIVGEIRGKEAYVMFQGMASGHPTISTMHAGSLDDVMNRLSSKPINLSPGLLDSLDMVIIMVHAREKGKSARRIREIVEIESVLPTGETKSVKSFVWNPIEDTYDFKGPSWLLGKISREKGIPMDKIMKELEKRKKFMQWMAQNNISNIKDVANYINLYRRNPDNLETIAKRLDDDKSYI